VNLHPPGTYARQVQEDPTHAVELLRAVNALDIYWDLCDPVEEGHEIVLHDPKELTEIMLAIGRLLNQVKAFPEIQPCG
jgi:hypothetical protein